MGVQNPLLYITREEVEVEPQLPIRICQAAKQLPKRWVLQLLDSGWDCLDKINGPCKTINGSPLDARTK